MGGARYSSVPLLRSFAPTNTPTPSQPLPEHLQVRLGANKKEQRSPARSLRGQVSQDWPDLQLSRRPSLHFHLFIYPHLQRFRKIYS